MDADILVAVIDLHPMELEAGLPQYLSLCVMNRRHEVVFSFQAVINVNSVEIVANTLDRLDEASDLRLVVDNAALVCSFLKPYCDALTPPRPGPQYRKNDDGALRWTPMLDIESLQLGFVAATASHMWDVDPKFGTEPEKELNKLIFVPPRVEETEDVADFISKTAHRVAHMYVSQLNASQSTRRAKIA